MDDKLTFFPRGVLCAGTVADRGPDPFLLLYLGVVGRERINSTKMLAVTLPKDLREAETRVVVSECGLVVDKVDVDGLKKPPVQAEWRRPCRSSRSAPISKRFGY